MKKAWKKLQSTAGESIAETLVAVLIIALAMATLAGMITATMRMVKSSEGKLNEYYDTTNKDLETFTNWKQGSVTITIPPESNQTGHTFNITSINVEYAENTTFESNHVISYHVTTPQAIGG